jgi:electron transfer flavoprotein alpha/beta subunit
MKAVVGVRPAPHRLLDEGGTAQPYRWHLSLVDRVAVEAALRTADTVLAVGVGGDTARQSVRSVLTMGADEAIQVAFDPIEEIVAEKYASVVARMAAREDADALYVGESAPLMGVEVAGLAGETLGWPALSRVTAIGSAVEDDHTDLDAEETSIQRKLAIGRQERLAVEFPAVIGVDAGYANPRRAGLETAIAGQRASIEQLPLEEVVPDQTRFSMSVGNATIEDVTPNQRWGSGRPPTGGTVEDRIYQLLGRGAGDERAAGERIDAPPEEAAKRVVSFLKQNELL